MKLKSAPAAARKNHLTKAPTKAPAAKKAAGAKASSGAKAASSTKSPVLAAPMKTEPAQVTLDPKLLPLGSPGSPYLSNGTVKPQLNAEAAEFQAEQTMRQQAIDNEALALIAKYSGAGSAVGDANARQAAAFRSELTNTRSQVLALREQITGIERKYGYVDPYVSDSHDATFYLGSGDGGFNALRFVAHQKQVAADKVQIATLRKDLQTTSARLAELMSQLKG